LFIVKVSTDFLFATLKEFHLLVVPIRVVHAHPKGLKGPKLPESAAESDSVPAEVDVDAFKLLFFLFVVVLLTRISGIPMLERRAEKRWGTDPEFRAYTDNTPVLIPRPPR